MSALHPLRPPTRSAKNTAPRPGSIVQRISLPELVARSLREGIDAGRWAASLPGECELCRELQVGRDTLRKAIALLVSEKRLVLGGRGRRHHIERSSKPPPTRLATGRVIRILTPLPPHMLGETHLAICDSLRERAERAGYRVEMELRPHIYRLREPAELARLHALPETAGWVVLFSTEAMQRMLLKRGIPAVLVGPPYPGVGLPAVWPDTAAVARHAAGLFHARGHRRVAYLHGEQPTLGSERAGLMFAEESARLGMRAHILRFGSPERAWSMRFDAVLALRPRPTAVLCAGSYLALGLLCRLQNEGLRVPRDISVVSLWPEGFMQHTVPALATYRVDSADMGRKIARLLLRRITGGSGEHDGIALLPDFQSGGSVGPPPAAGRIVDQATRFHRYPRQALPLPRFARRAQQAPVRGSQPPADTP